MHSDFYLNACNSIGIAPIIQLQMCVRTIVHIEWDHLMWNTLGTAL